VQTGQTNRGKLQKEERVLEVRVVRALSLICTSNGED